MQGLCADGSLSLEGWIEMMEQMKRSADFLRTKMQQFWPEQ